MIKNKRKSSKLKYIIPVVAIVMSIIVISCMEDEAAEPEVVLELDVQASQVSTETLESVDGPIFTEVEVIPQFPGGDKAMYKYFGKNINYPESAKQAGEEGRVFVQFLILKDGSVAHVNAIKGISPELDAEAVRVVSTMPTWTPAQQRGHNVNVRMVLPIFFQINPSTTSEVETVDTETVSDRLERIKATIDDDAKKEKIELILESLDEGTSYQSETRKESESELEELVVTTYQ